MKNLSFLIPILVLSIYISTAETRRDFNFKFDGVDRNFVMSIPSGNAPTGGFPIVMMLHGTTGDGDKFYTISGWKELGEREKFISVFPSSLEFCFIGSQGFKTMTTKWNNGEAQSAKCPNLVQDFKDDVKFLRKVVDTVKKLYIINNNKIYVSGFSNGSAMANKLAVEMSDIFAAAASGSGLLSPLDSAKPVRYIPIWQIIGTHDAFIIEALGRPFPFNDSLNLIVPNSTNTFRGVANLTDKYKLNKTNITYTYIYDQPKSGNQKNYLYYTYIKEMEHIFPNGLNYPLSAPTLFWEFFKQASAINTTPIQSIQIKSDIQIFPNPAKNYLNIKQTSLSKNEKTEMKIYDILGREKIYTEINNHISQVNISSLSPGIYKIYLKNKEGYAVKSIQIE